MGWFNKVFDTTQRLSPLGTALTALEIGSNVFGAFYQGRQADANTARQLAFQQLEGEKARAFTAAENEKSRAAQAESQLQTIRNQIAMLDKEIAARSAESAADRSFQEKMLLLNLQSQRQNLERELAARAAESNKTLALQREQLAFEKQKSDRAFAQEQANLQYQRNVAQTEKSGRTVNRARALLTTGLANGFLFHGAPSGWSAPRIPNAPTAQQISTQAASLR